MGKVGKVKKILMLAIGFCLILTGTASADYLACDLQQNIKASEVELDGTIMPGIAVVSGSNLLLLDVSGLGTGPHTFKARLQDTSGWWGEWSPVPFAASKPDGVALKIVGE